MVQGTLTSESISSLLYRGKCGVESGGHGAGAGLSWGEEWVAQETTPNGTFCPQGANFSQTGQEPGGSPL